MALLSGEQQNGKIQFSGVLRGDEELMLRLSRIGKKTPAALGVALEREAGIELEEMIQRTPRATGALRDSGGHSRWFEYKGAVAVLIRFGGPDAWYAIIVEKAKNEHLIGQRRYMQSVVKEARTHLLTRIAKELNIEGSWTK